MNLKNLHKLQFKTAVYKLLTCPGVLTEDDIRDVLAEIVEEIDGGELNA